CSYSVIVTCSPLCAISSFPTRRSSDLAVPFDYVLSNNGPVSITAGSSGTVTITAKLTGGAAQSVALSCVTPLPSGITCTSFSPASVRSEERRVGKVLTFLVAPSVAAGSYSVMVTGSPLGATTTATTVAVTVIAVPYVSGLSTNAPPIITAGSSGTVTITAKLTGGAAQSVALSCVTPLPSGITCTSFSPASVTPTSAGATSILTISVASSVAAGSSCEVLTSAL